MTTMADRDGKIWLDGQLVDWGEAKVHVLTHTLHYGMGAFEGVRAYNTSRGTAIFRLAEHTRRLCRSAKILGMAMPYSEDELNAAIEETKKQLKAAEPDVAERVDEDEDMDEDGPSTGVKRRR